MKYAVVTSVDGPHESIGEEYPCPHFVGIYDTKEEAEQCVKDVIKEYVCRYDDEEDFDMDAVDIFYSKDDTIIFTSDVDTVVVRIESLE